MTARVLAFPANTPPAPPGPPTFPPWTPPAPFEVRIRGGVAGTITFTAYDARGLPLLELRAPGEHSVSLDVGCAIMEQLGEWCRAIVGAGPRRASDEDG